MVQGRMKLLQLNLNHCQAAQNLLNRSVRELNIDITILRSHIADTFHRNRLAKNQMSQTIPTIRKDVFVSANVNGIYIYSFYIPPRYTDKDFIVIIAWLVSDMLNKDKVQSTVLDIVLLNTDNEQTFSRNGGRSRIDIAFASSNIANRIKWSISDIYSQIAHLAEAEANATGNSKDKEPWNVENPFQRSSGMQRTPPTPSLRSTPAQATTNANYTNQEHNASKNSPFLELGNMIDEQAWAIKNMYNKAKLQTEGKEPSQAMEISVKATQTTPKLCPTEAPQKRSRDSGEGSPKIQATKRSKKADKLQKEKQEREGPRPEEPPLEENKTWKTVKNKSKPRKRRNAAMIITAKGGTSYADILKQLKGDPSLKDVGESVSRIRRTQKGELLLEINTNDQASVDLFRGQMKKSIGPKADIMTRRQETIIECRDIDEVTTKDDIRNAFLTQLGVSEMKLEDIKSLRRAYGGTQTATISLPSEICYRLLQIGKVKIGWVVCRIRERVNIRQCYRCLGYAHLAEAEANATGQFKRQGAAGRGKIPLHQRKFWNARGRHLHHSSRSTPGGPPRRTTNANYT
ncbi:hypothetical protein CVS40_8204 [Lucilia cuprina]|nr:hypothetical protein CVS40_8204 [Lucilia cuprina]